MILEDAAVEESLWLHACQTKAGQNNKLSEWSPRKKWGSFFYNKVPRVDRRKSLKAQTCWKKAPDDRELYEDSTWN